MEKGYPRARTRDLPACLLTPEKLETAQTDRHYHIHPQRAESKLLLGNPGLVVPSFFARPGGAKLPQESVLIFWNLLGTSSCTTASTHVGRCFWCFPTFSSPWRPCVWRADFGSGGCECQFQGGQVWPVGSLGSKKSFIGGQAWAAVVSWAYTVAAPWCHLLWDASPGPHTLYVVLEGYPDVLWRGQFRNLLCRVRGLLVFAGWSLTSRTQSRSLYSPRSRLELSGVPGLPILSATCTAVLPVAERHIP